MSCGIVLVIPVLNYEFVYKGFYGTSVLLYNMGFHLGLT